MEFLKDPLYNATFSGILIYILIKISNKGDPVIIFTNWSVWPYRNPKKRKYSKFLYS